MKKILITGGTGTVGSSFIQQYYSEFEFYNFSRNEMQIAKLSRDFPNVKSFVGDICNLEQLINVYANVQPDIVIHTAAMKHIDLVEQNPSRATEINVNGSMNVIKASIMNQTPLTIGISTDKACNPDSVYGYTKYLMEKLFMQNHNSKTKFVCTRFANVAGSSGSVIPFWKENASKGLALKLTDPDMNRLMFSKKAATKLIYSAITLAESTLHGFTLAKVMKSVNMYKLAKTISDKIEIVGKRAGEKINEKLISESELPFTNEVI